MKKILTFACLFLGLSSFAQLPVFPKRSKPVADFLQKDRFVNKVNAPYSTMALLTGSYATGNIYALPQDKMPCLVPDTKLLTPIPNRGISAFRNSLMMPNALVIEDVIPAQ